MCKASIFEGRPVVSAVVVFPAHLQKGETPPLLDFLVDTGADTTLINAIDAEKLGIEYHTSAEGERIATYDGVPLREGPMMGGIGGGIRTYEIRNVSLILLTWSGKKIIEIHQESLPSLHVPEGRVRAIPNLLGRDIINRFNLVVKPADRTLELTRAPIKGSYTVTYF